MAHLRHTRLLILADIEGSTGCMAYENGKVFGKGWARVCREMTRDINTLSQSLFAAGATQIRVKDFHRSGHNLVPQLLDPRIHLDQGYATGPVPGMGDPGKTTALLLIGHHAPSGAPGFLPHTMTSRLGRVEIRSPGHRPSLLTEAQLFSHSLAPRGLVPVFFTGCPYACSHAGRTIPGLQTFELDKFAPDFHAPTWRDQMSRAAVQALTAPTRHTPYHPQGPFQVRITLRDGAKAAQKIAQRWNIPCKRDDLFIRSNTLSGIYDQLVPLAYLTPLTARFLSRGLPLFNLAAKTALKLSQAFSRA